MSSAHIEKRAAPGSAGKRFICRRPRARPRAGTHGTAQLQWIAFAIMLFAHAVRQGRGKAGSEPRAKTNPAATITRHTPRACVAW